MKGKKTSIHKKLHFVYSILILFFSLNSFAINQMNGEIHIRDFGAIGDGITNDTKAFQKASAYLEANGGTLIIDSGTYIAGKQKLSGSYYAGYSYYAEPILEFKYATKPIIIIGHNATLQAAADLKFGFFNPITGLKDSIRQTGNRSSYYATAYIFINAVGCKSISIEGLTLDGNSGKLNIGPSYDDIGIQLMATGIRLYNNQYVQIKDSYIHHCGLDGIIIAWTGLTDDAPAYPHTLTNVKVAYSGRQGLSWVGGNDLTITDCRFLSTGKALNKGLPIVSKPSAGIDIEIENSIIKNGHFINCLISDNAGPGVVSIGHDTHNIHFKKCTFIGTTNSAAYPKSQGFSFDSCVFVGKVERIFGSTNIAKTISFKNCIFTMDKKMSPAGQVFGDHCEFYEAENVIFERCKFDADSRALPVFSPGQIVFVNCSFRQNSNADFNAAATFKGLTRFNMEGSGKINFSDAKFEGPLIYNNKRISHPEKENLNSLIK